MHICTIYYLRDMIHLIINFGELFHLKDLLVILPVPPPLDAKYDTFAYKHHLNYHHKFG
jgi:hypothetical protein